VRSLFASALFGLGVTACQPAEIAVKTENANLADFAALAEMTFETSVDNTDNIISDRRVRVTSEALEGVWFYTQLNTGPDRKLYRQRLSNIKLSDDGSAVIQKTYGLNNPEKYTEAWNHPALLNTLTPADFKPYFNVGCEQVWRPGKDGAWSGYVNPATCIITSKRRNKDIRIESESYLSKDIYRTNERGYDMDMTWLWGTKPGEMISLYPIQEQD